MNKNTWLVIYRLALGSLGLVAVGWQLSISLDHDADIVNFFSYFTILSNIFASIVLLISAFRLARGYKPTSMDDTLRGAATIAIILVGIVYIALLRNEELGPLSPWINAVTHYVMPLGVLADWLFKPPKSRFSRRHVIVWLVYPLTFLVYTLIRGPIADWYPYEFLNPSQVGGYLGVAAYSLVILAAFLLTGRLLLWLTGPSSKPKT